MRCNPKLGPPAVSLCQHYFSWFLRDHKPLDLGIENFESFPFWFEFCALWSENISFGFFHYTLFFSFLLIKILFVFIIIICILSSSNFYFVLCRHHYVQGQDAFQIYLRVSHLPLHLVRLRQTVGCTHNFKVASAPFVGLPSSSLPLH